MALVSICTAYLCCQLPRWVDLVVTALTRSELIGEICYTLVIGPLFYLLYRFFVRPAYAAMMASPQSLLLFGSLPVAYYFFDYATVVYSDALYRGYGAINEFLPTALIIFYVMFLTAYHAQSSRRAQAEMQSTMLEAGLKQSQIEVDALRRAEMQTAVYQHDMRHHLNAIDGFLAAGKPQQAEEYIRKVRSDIERITPKRYCDNELVNLLCSSFAGKAQRMGVRLEVDAKLPRELSVSDTELCAVLSNALENALRAVSDQPEADRWVTLYCGVRLSCATACRSPSARGMATAAAASRRSPSGAADCASSAHGAASFPCSSCCPSKRRQKPKTDAGGCRRRGSLLFSSPRGKKLKKVQNMAVLSKIPVIQ